MRLGAWLLDLFFPPKCVFCGKLMKRGEREICTACRLALPICGEERKAGPYLSGCRAALYYEGNVREALLRYKFHGKMQYASVFGPMAAAAASALPLEEIDLVTWVPVSRKRRRQRGYDQAMLLARETAKALNKPLGPTLKKIRHNRAQSSLESAEQRRANVLGVYAPLRRTDLKGGTVLLIDDIVTTGSTMEEAARTILTAGASAVYGAALAARRGDGKHGDEEKG